MYANSDENLNEKEKNWLQFILENNLVSRQFMYTFSNNKSAFMKSDIAVLKLFLTVTVRKSFAFDSWFMKKTILFWCCDFLDRWGKTVSPKMKTVSHFPNHDGLVCTLCCNLLVISDEVWNVRALTKTGADDIIISRSCEKLKTNLH